MIKFLDGPAAGVVLMLRNAPESLRVVRSTDGKWDALDQPGDQPRRDEEVFMYLRQGSAGFACIDYGGRGGRRGKTVVVAQYRHAKPDLRVEVE